MVVLKMLTGQDFPFKKETIFYSVMMVSVFPRAKR